MPLDNELENSQEVKEPIKPVANRRSDGTFGPGNNANPQGRPVGQSLKEYDREKFAKMTPEEKEEFLKTISAEMRYRMAEGNPHQTTDTLVELKPSPLLNALRNNPSNPQDSELKKTD